MRPIASRLLQSCASALLLCLALVGCNDAKQALTELRAESSAPVDPFASDAVARGAAELERTLGAPVQALSVEVTPHRILFSVQDPKMPDNVDAYELRNGVLLPPQPVQLMGGGDLAANLFPLAEVPLGRLPELCSTAAKSSGVEDGKVQSLTIRRKFSALASMPGAAELQAAMERSRLEMGGPVATPDPEQLPEGAIGVELYVDGPRRRGFVLADGGDFAIVRVRQM
jgi:hypothetical protein